LVSAVVFEGRLVEAVFLDRPNRFLASVNVNGEKLSSFVPNPGRMHELLRPGVNVVLRVLKKRGRKTCFDLIGVFYKRQLVSVDSRIPNKLVFVALKKGDIKEFTGYTNVKPEYNYGHARFDFLLTNHTKPCLLEVKSCTLVRDGKALFPDAVTVRGRKHVEQLAEARAKGYRACVLFIVQRNDASVFSPNDEVDPKFSKTLREAVENGVEVYAYYSEFDGNKIVLRGELGVEL